MLPRSGAYSRRHLEGLLAREGLRLDVALESGGWELLETHIAAGLGIAVMPALALSPADHRRFEIRRMTGLLGVDECVLLSCRDRPSSRASEAFGELCPGHAP